MSPNFKARIVRRLINHIVLKSSKQRDSILGPILYICVLLFCTNNNDYIYIEGL